MTDTVVSTLPEAIVLSTTSADTVVTEQTTATTINVVTTETISAESSTSTVTVPVVSNTTVEVEKSTVIVAGGGQGPQGPPGDSINYINILAGQDLSGHRVVSSNNSGYAVYADKDLADTGNKVLGITTGAILNGGMAEVQIVGVLEEPSWSWNSTDPIFIGSNGQLTQTAPSTGYLYIVAFPMSPTKIFIDKQPPIVLG